MNKVPWWIKEVEPVDGWADYRVRRWVPEWLRRLFPGKNDA